MDGTKNAALWHQNPGLSQQKHLGKDWDSEELLLKNIAGFFRDKTLCSLELTTNKSNNIVLIKNDSEHIFCCKL